MSRLQARLLGLATTLGLIAFAIGTPVLLVTIGAVPDFGTFGPGVLTTPDDGTLALALVAVVAWAAWLVMTTALLIEVLAQVRGVRVRSVPGLRAPQLAASRIVATASLLFITAPLASPAVSSPQPDAASSPATLAAVPSAKEAANPPSAEAEVPSVVAPPRATTSYVTRRGDSLWRIAENRLGDGRRYVEILDLNRDVLDGKPDFIPVGLAIRLPVQPDADLAPDASTYVVQPGDTLSEIAEDELGDPTRYPAIYRASRDTLQPDGEHLIDPDLIRPGWSLTLPDHSRDSLGTKGHPSRPPVEAEPEPEPEPTPPVPSATIPVQPTPSDDTTLTPADPETDADADADADQQGAELPGWVLPGLTSGGALLAGAVLLVVRAHRRTQLRYRRPGQVIVPPPPELVPIEKTLHLTGTTNLPKVERLDALLRHLRATMDSLPALSAAELTTETVALHLAAPSTLPEPWRGADLTWAADLAADIPTDLDVSAAYPLLVSVGQTEDGHLWLVNLEQLQTIDITGDPNTAESFARHLVAELAINPWSIRVEVDAVGIAAELEGISWRLNVRGCGDTEYLRSIEESLDSDITIDGVDPEILHAVVTTGASEALDRVRGLITTSPRRSGAVVVTLDHNPASGSTTFSLDATGRLRVDALDLDVTASGLTSEEAAACAAIVDVTRIGENTPSPNRDEEDGPLEALIDSGGALRPELTEPRPQGPAGSASLLPDVSADYEVETATTMADVEALAPITRPTTRARVRDADPTLDDDLSAWHDPDLHLPKLTLLGPVSASARGHLRVVTARLPFYVELLAYLSLHPRGATSDEVATAFFLTRERAYVDLANLRKWLGTDPRNGQAFVPRLRATRGDRETTEATYRVNGVLSDYDLFRRLRARGQARGAEGIGDLTSALELVSGEPFTQLRENGWSWLLEGQRLDHVITCAIVDVGHIVKTHALKQDDLDLARTAVEISYTAAPYDETARLDLIQVASVSGHADLAERLLVDGIFNRSDDDHGPIDLPRRTAHLVTQRAWDQTRSAASRRTTRD